MPIPQRKKVTTMVSVAARAFDEALPKLFWTRVAVSPVRFRWLTRCCAKTLTLPPTAYTAATNTSAAGSTDSEE